MTERTPRHWHASRVASRVVWTSTSSSNKGATEESVRQQRVWSQDPAHHQNFWFWMCIEMQKEKPSHGPCPWIKGAREVNSYKRLDIQHGRQKLKIIKNLNKCHWTFSQMDFVRWGNPHTNNELIVPSGIGALWCNSQITWTGPSSQVCAQLLQMD